MPKTKTPTGHVFGKPRPSKRGTFPLHQTPKRDTHFRPLPTQRVNSLFIWI